MNIIVMGRTRIDALWPLIKERSLDSEAQKKDIDSALPVLACAYLRKEYPTAHIVVTLAQKDKALLANCGEGVKPLLLPCERGSFWELVLASLMLREEYQLFRKETVLVCYADELLNPKLRKSLPKLERYAKNNAGLTVLSLAGLDKNGAEWRVPDRYTDSATGMQILDTKDKTLGRGICAFSIQYLLSIALKICPCDSFKELAERYRSLPPLSLDRATATDSLAVIDSAVECDLAAAWEKLRQNDSKRERGQVYVREDCEDSFFINETSYPLVCAGVRDVVVAASPNGILVSAVDKLSSTMAELDRLKPPTLLTQKDWGTVQMLDQSGENRIAKITVQPDRHTSYCSHEQREERLLVVSGSGFSLVEGMEQRLGPGDLIYVRRGYRHAIIAQSQMTLIELQTGLYDEEDEIEYEWLY